MITIGLNFVQYRAVCLSVREHNSRKSRESLKRFSQNFVLHIFRAREDDLDRSELCKKMGLCVFLSVLEYISRKSREPF